MSDVAPLRRAVESGYTGRQHVGDDKYLLFYPDGRHAFEHRCDRSQRGAGVIICAPLVVPPDHQVAPGPTVTPSIHCLDCGTHGFITNGQWIPC